MFNTTKLSNMLNYYVTVQWAHGYGSCFYLLLHCTTIDWPLMWGIDIIREVKIRPIDSSFLSIEKLFNTI